MFFDSIHKYRLRTTRTSGTDPTSEMCQGTPARPAAFLYHVFQTYISRLSTLLAISSHFYALIDTFYHLKRKPCYFGFKHV